MIYKLKDIVQKKDGLLRGPFGSALKKSVFVPEDTDTYKVYEQCVPLEQNENLGNYYISKEYYETNVRRFNVLPKDFLVSCSGVNYGAIYQLSNKAKPGVINQALLRIRLNNEIIDDDYFLYLFKSLIYKKITKGTGDSTIPNFPSMEIVKNIEFDIPDICLQKRISSFFKKIDIKINANNEINNLLESLAKTLYDYWFLQFEFPNEEGKPYKSSGGKMVWNEELKREIPEGWEVKTLNDISRQVNGYPFSTDDYLSEGFYKLYTIKNVQDTGIDSKTEAFFNELPLNMNDDCLLKPEDLIMSLTGNVGRVGIVYEENALLNQRVLKLVEEKVSKEYLYCLLKNESFRRQMERIATGTSQKNLSPISLGELFIVVPDDNILKSFNLVTKGLIKKITSNNKQNQQLSSLRDWLLPMLMNGQVTFEKKKDAA